MNPVETVVNFIYRINQRDVAKLAEMMTEDHLFIDSLGRPVRGREEMRAGWEYYFKLCPDYWITSEAILSSDDLVAVFGAAGGTIASGGQCLPANQWQTPAAWRAIVENGLIKEWRVYADNKPAYDILARTQSYPAR